MRVRFPTGRGFSASSSLVYVSLSMSPYLSDSRVTMLLIWASCRANHMGSFSSNSRVLASVLFSRASLVVMVEVDLL